MKFSSLLAASAVLALAAFTTPAISSKPAVNDQMVVTTAWLASHLSDPSLVVIEIGPDSSFASGHIPGARVMNYQDLVTRRDGISSEVPDADSIRAVFERQGVSDNSHVVIYAPEGPMASRALMTLDYIGHKSFSFLDGGFDKWKAEKRALERGEARIVTGHITPHPRPEIIATADYITAHAGKKGISLIDTRTDGEYVGAGERHGMPSAGHIAGAHQLQWEQLFVNDSSSELKPRAELQKLYAERVQAGDTVVTYCWVGYRASMTYFVARYLGYPVKLYDGSYQDWQKRQLPVTAGTTP